MPTVKDVHIELRQTSPATKKRKRAVMAYSCNFNDESIIIGPCGHYKPKLAAL